MFLPAESAHLSKNQHVPGTINGQISLWFNLDEIVWIDPQFDNNPPKIATASSVMYQIGRIKSAFQARVSGWYWRVFWLFRVKPAPQTSILLGGNVENVISWSMGGFSGTGPGITIFSIVGIKCIASLYGNNTYDPPEIREMTKLWFLRPCANFR